MADTKLYRVRDRIIVDNQVAFSPGDLIAWEKAQELHAAGLIDDPEAGAESTEPQPAAAPAAEAEVPTDTTTGKKGA